MRRTQLRLTPALVPMPLWGKSVYNTLPRKQWEALRRTVLEAAANTCGHCDAQYDSGMVCHEAWEYDDRKHLATLTAFVIVCRDCNSVLHLGKSLLIGEKKGRSGLVDRGEQAVEHLKKVNGITDQETRKLIKDAFKTHSARSRHVWEIQIPAHMIEKHPILADLKL
jgi:hypothetical protein